MWIRVSRKSCEPTDKVLLNRNSLVGHLCFQAKVNFNLMIPTLHGRLGKLRGYGDIGHCGRHAVRRLNGDLGILARAVCKSPLQYISA